MSDSKKEVRVRFAPSPTGYLHVGGARTAIFNWLFARHTGGAFVLRIEDTDAERSSGESEASLLEDLRWLGLDWDEGPETGGPHAPYRQSERLDLYRAAADDLIARGLAYPCFCTDADLERKREAATAAGRATHYDGTCRDLSPAQVAARRKDGIPETVRFKVPAEVVSFDDAVRGPIDLDTDMVGDFVIIRSNALPTYNFAATCDDRDMRITHVIRGEEHLPNTLRQMLVYNALGARPPVFAHVPLILAEDRSKLSKRHGASSVGELRSQGYLPSAAVNYLVLLGWSHPREKEVLSLDELIETFTIKRINKSAAVFDPKKLAWMNGQHLRALDSDAVFDVAEPFLPSWLPERYDKPERREIVAILRDRLDVLSALEEQTRIFRDDVAPDAEAAELLATEGARAVTSALTARLRDANEAITPDAFNAMIKDTGTALGVKGKDLYFPIRAAITGSVHGPDLARVASVKGRDSVLHLLDSAAGK
jgi:nondiscriminating glutamyl-tRNA synthetase